VDLGFQAYPGHSQRIVNSLLVVHDVLLRQDMEDLPVEGQSDGLGRIQDPVDVRLVHFPTLDGDHPVAVQTLDVSPGDPGVHRRDFTARHQFRFFHGLANGVDRLIDIDHHPGP